MGLLTAVAGAISAVAALATVALAAWALRYARETVKIAREVRADDDLRRAREYLAGLDGLVEAIGDEAEHSTADPAAP